MIGLLFALSGINSIFTIASVASPWVARNTTVFDAEDNKVVDFTLMQGLFNTGLGFEVSQAFAILAMLFSWFAVVGTAYHYLKERGVEKAELSLMPYHLVTTGFHFIVFGFSMVAWGTYAVIFNKNKKNDGLMDYEKYGFTIGFALQILVTILSVAVLVISWFHILGIPNCPCVNSTTTQQPNSPHNASSEQQMMYQQQQQPMMAQQQQQQQPPMDQGPPIAIEHVEQPVGVTFQDDSSREQEMQKMSA